MNPYRREKRIIASVTFAASLVGYLYAKTATKDPVPIVMVCGFAGSLLGEALAQFFNGNNQPPPSGA